MSVSVRPFGFTREGEDVRAYTIVNDVGASCTLLDYGATVQSLLVPNRDGRLTDVVLGFDTVAGYENQAAFIGATIGRVGNRIGGARFSLNGRKKGFDKYVWAAEIAGDCAVRFSRLSPDGEENFPGNLEVSVTFRLIPGRAELRIDYDAVSDADTLFAPTNHSYFDLSGCGMAMEQQLRINADRYLLLGPGTLPTGKTALVYDTAFDFTQFKPVGRDIGADDEQLRLGGGYDHNFCLSGPFAAELKSEVTGICMQVFTDMPGVQLYTANFLGNQIGKGGREMQNRGAVCLETQLWPNAMNCWGFPSPVMRKGQPAHSGTVYSFELT